MAMIDSVVIDIKMPGGEHAQLNVKFPAENGMKALVEENHELLALLVQSLGRGMFAILMQNLMNADFTLRPEVVCDIEGLPTLDQLGKA